MVAVPTSSSALVRFAGRVGDHNDNAMVGSGVLADALAERLGIGCTVIGHPRQAISQNWDAAFADARAELLLLQECVAGVLGEGLAPVIAGSRCASALATIPAVVAAHPDVVVVWFDAHADLNTPETSTSGYLGGMALSGTMGWWPRDEDKVGLGSGLVPGNVILVGARDIDPPELDAIARHGIEVVGPGVDVAERLRLAVAGRKTYIHVDCDVLEPGIVPTDYRVPNGLTLDQFADAMSALAETGIAGIELSEFEYGEDAETIHAAQRLVEACRACFSACRPTAEVRRGTGMKRRMTPEEARRVSPP